MIYIVILGSGQKDDLLGDHVAFETVLNTSATGAVIPAMEYSSDNIKQKEILEEEPNETNGLQPSREKSVQSLVKPDESAGPPADEYMFFEDTDNDADEILPVEQRLMNHLLRNYERSVRPVKNASDTVFVRMGLTLTQIFDMVSKIWSNKVFPVPLYEALFISYEILPMKSGWCIE